MKTIILVIILSVIIVGLSFLGLGIQTFFSKKKKFPETSVGKNKEMKKLNIKCAKCEELERCKLRDAAKDNHECTICKE